MCPSATAARQSASAEAPRQATAARRARVEQRRLQGSARASERQSRSSRVHRASHVSATVHSSRQLVKPSRQRRRPFPSRSRHPRRQRSAASPVPQRCSHGSLTLRASARQSRRVSAQRDEQSSTVGGSAWTMALPATNARTTARHLLTDLLSYARRADAARVFMRASQPRHDELVVEVTCMNTSHLLSGCV